MSMGSVSPRPRKAYFILFYFILKSCDFVEICANIKLAHLWLSTTTSTSTTMANGQLRRHHQQHHQYHLHHHCPHHHRQHHEQGLETRCVSRFCKFFFFLFNIILLTKLLITDSIWTRLTATRPPQPPIPRARALPPWAPAPQALRGTKMRTGMDRWEERQGKRMGLEMRLVSSPWYVSFLFFWTILIPIYI